MKIIVFIVLLDCLSFFLWCYRNIMRQWDGDSHEHTVPIHHIIQHIRIQYIFIHTWHTVLPVPTALVFIAQTHIFEYVLHILLLHSQQLLHPDVMWNSNRGIVSYLFVSRLPTWDLVGVTTGIRIPIRS